MQYNFLDNSFTTYEDVGTPEEKVQIDMPLMDKPFDISNWASGITSNGTIVVKDKTAKFKMINNNNQEQSSIQNSSTKNISIPETKGSQAFSKLLDEVSNEEGFEGLKDPKVKHSLMLQAKRESNFNSGAKSKSSTASGYFQFIDGTRAKYSKISKEQFLNDPKEQIRTAYKYYKDIHNMSDARKMKERGYNNDLITALGWWYPRSMGMVLNGNTNFSLGGYSIKKALQDYG